MSANGSTSGVTSHSKLTGIRPSSEMTVEMLNTEGNVILRELEQQVGQQRIIRRDFSGGQVVVMLNNKEFERAGLNVENVKVAVNRSINYLNNEIKSAQALQKAMLKKGDSWGNYERAKAREKFAKQALSKMKQAQKKLNK